MLKKIFDVLVVFLTGRKSQYVLVKQTGWLCEEALDKLKVPAYDDLKKFIDFDKAFVCNPRDDHYGFISWDNPFAGEFATGFGRWRILTVLNPPALPSSPPAAAHTLSLQKDAAAVNGLSTPHVGGNFWGFSVEMSVISQVRKYL
jgi:hypothetical protein